MFESSLSWLTVPITFTASFNKKSTRRGNTHEFFCPVSVYKTSDGFVYLAVGNDRQWQSLVSQDIFKPLDTPAYEKNAGRIADVQRLNQLIEDITINHEANDLIRLFKSITLPASKINTMADVVRDPLVAKRLLYSKDERTGAEITLAPPPYMTPWLEQSGKNLSFPPRFGEHNAEIYGKHLGFKPAELKRLQENKVI
jgi:crotonobetainyl-CoA:carnitine CoA-transferase CaiB-like acyl-CoA transferase